MFHFLALFHFNQAIFGLIHLKRLHSCFKLIQLINYLQKFPHWIVDFSSNLFPTLYSLFRSYPLEYFTNFYHLIQFFKIPNSIQVQSIHHLFESIEILNLHHFSLSDFHFANTCPYQVKIHC